MAEQTVNIEWNDHDIYMNFYADMEWNDYGVDGSPRWLEPTNIKWDEYEVDGCNFSYEEMVNRFGKESVDKIDELLLEVSNNKDWNVEEEPYYEEDERDDE